MSTTLLEPSAPPRQEIRQPSRTPFLPWLLLSATMVILGVMTGYPVLRLFVMSFQEYERAQLMGLPAEWVGFDNYATVLTEVSC